MIEQSVYAGARASVQRASYESYIQSSHWKELRSVVFEFAGHKCEACKNKGNLQGHHLVYKKLYDCTARDVMCLCEDCHGLWHLHFTAREYFPRDFVRGFLAGIRSSGIRSKAELSKPDKMAALDQKEIQKKNHATNEKNKARRMALRAQVDNDPKLMGMIRSLNEESFKKAMKTYFRSGSDGRDIKLSRAWTLYRSIPHPM